MDFLEAWIKQHAADAAAMGKPFMIEEFGKEVHLENGAQANITSIRGPFYRKVYQQLQESLDADGPLRGTHLLRWPWYQIEWLQVFLFAEMSIGTLCDTDYCTGVTLIFDTRY